MQSIALLNPRDEGPPPAASAQMAPPREEPPAGARKPDLYHWLAHIHDGEIVGPAGRVASLILGLALLFFSVSGIWMYWKMFDARRRTGKADPFW